MHLDTVFTQIDKDKFAIFSNYPFEIFKLEDDNGDIKITKITKKIDEFLGEIFGVDKVTLIQAGNGDPVYSERDQ
jgi:arginine deiminase